MGVIEVHVDREEVVPAEVTGAGPYLKVVGRFRGGVDPYDPWFDADHGTDVAIFVDGVMEYNHDSHES